MRFKKNVFMLLAAVLLATTSYAETVYVKQASETQKEIIQTALGGQYPISKTAAVKSFTQDGVYYVGAEFHTSEAGNMIGVWLLDQDKRSPGLVCSVDGIAYLFSGVIKANAAMANVTDSDPEVRLVKKYLEQ